MALICWPGPSSISLVLPAPMIACSVPSHRTGSISCRASMSAIPSAVANGVAVTLEYTGMRGSLIVT